MVSYAWVSFPYFYKNNQYRFHIFTKDKIPCSFTNILCLGWTFLYFRHYLINKVILILSYSSNALECWCVKYTSKNQNSELKVFLKKWDFGETLNNWTNDLFGAHVYKFLNHVNNHSLTILEWTSTTCVIFQRGTFSTF